MSAFLFPNLAPPSIIGGGVGGVTSTGWSSGSEIYLDALEEAELAQKARRRAIASVSAPKPLGLEHYHASAAAGAGGATSTSTSNKHTPATATQQHSGSQYGSVGERMNTTSSSIGTAAHTPAGSAAGNGSHYRHEHTTTTPHSSATTPSPHHYMVSGDAYSPSHHTQRTPHPARYRRESPSPQFVEEGSSVMEESDAQSDEAADGRHEDVRRHARRHRSPAHAHAGNQHQHHSHTSRRSGSGTRPPRRSRTPTPSRYREETSTPPPHTSEEPRVNVNLSPVTARGAASPRMNQSYEPSELHRRHPSYRQRRDRERERDREVSRDREERYDATRHRFDDGNEPDSFAIETMTPAGSSARRETRRYQRTASKSDTRPDTQTPTNDLLMMNSNPPSAVGGPPVMDGYGFEDDSFGCGSGVVTTPRNFTFERSLAEEVTHSAGGFEDGLVAAADAGEDVYSDSTPRNQRNRYEYSVTSNSGGTAAGASTNTLVDGERAVDGRNEGSPTTAAERQQAHRVRRHSSGHSIGSIE